MSYKVLIIDDQEDFLQNLVAFLNQRAAKETEEGQNIEFIGLSDPTAVLARITKDQPDVVLLDIYFGDHGTTGKSILKKIKDYYPYMPVIMITGEQKRSGVEAGREHYWQADGLVYKEEFITNPEEGRGFSAYGRNSLKDICFAAIDYYGIPSNPIHNISMTEDPRLHSSCSDQLNQVQNYSSDERSVFFLQGELGTGKRLFALAMQKEILNLKDASALTEINCACLKQCRDLKDKEDFLELFASSKDRVLFLRDVDRVPGNLKDILFMAIEEWKESAWIFAAVSKKTDTGIFSGENIEIDFPSLEDRLNADRRKKGNEEFFKKLCETIVKHRQIFRKQCDSDSIPGAGVINQDTLWLLILHGWSKNIRELEEVLSVAVDAAKEIGVIKPGHIRYNCYDEPSVCKSADDVILESDRDNRIILISKRKKNDVEFIYELLTRAYVNNIFTESTNFKMEGMIKKIGLNYDSVKQHGIIRRINSKINQAKEELGLPKPNK